MCGSAGGSVNGCPNGRPTTGEEMTGGVNNTHLCEYKIILKYYIDI